MIKKREWDWERKRRKERRKEKEKIITDKSDSEIVCKRMKD